MAKIGKIAKFQFKKKEEGGDYRGGRQIINS